MNIIDDREKLVKQAIKDASIEKPGIGFSKSVMEKVSQISEDNSIQISSAPLISVKGWLLISAIIIVIFSILIAVEPSSININSLINISDYTPTFSINLDIPFSVSKIFLIGVFAFTFFFIIEISLISRRLKRLR